MSTSTRIFLLALTYWVTGWLGLQMPYLGQNITLVWLPSGIAVAALYRYGRHVWPGIFIGAILVNLSIGSAWSVALGIALGNTLAPVLAAEWLRRHQFHAAFDRQRDVGLYIVATAMGMVVSAFGGVACLYGVGVMPVESIGTAWLSWWMGDTVGALLAGPLLLCLNRQNLMQFSRDRGALVLWLVIAIPVAWFAFVHDYLEIGRSLPLAFLTLPLFAWAALRFGITGAALAGLGFSVVAAWSTAAGHGTFSLPHPHLSLVLLWTYMASTVLTGLLITAMQAERRAVEHRFSDLVSSTDGIVWEADAITFGFVFVSQNAERMLGYPTADWLQPEFWTRHIHPEDRDQAVQYCATCTGRMEKHDFEYRFIAAEGRVVWLRDVVQVVTENGHPRWLRGLMIDITLQKQAQQALQTSLEEKNALLLEVHHRVRNNLQVITSLLRLERFRSTDAPTKSVLQDMQSRIRSMALLHEAIYRKGTFAAIDLGSYVGKIASESVKTLSTTPGAVQLCLDVGEVQVGLDQATPCGMLLSELVSNCLKHGFPEGQAGEIHISLRPLHEPDLWRLRVSDTGIGLPADIETHRKKSLGLHLVGDLATQMGGTLDIGGGPRAEFTVDFKVQTPASILIHLGPVA